MDGPVHRRLVRDDGLLPRAPTIGDSRTARESEQGYEVVYTVRQYAADVSPFKRITSSLYYRFINSITDLAVQDGSADFRLISGKVRDVLKNALREQNQFLRGLIWWVGFRSTYVMFRSRTRNAVESKYRLRELLKFAAVGIIIPFSG
jgi:polyisoprenyl-phosphate glycosyltransferase